MTSNYGCNNPPNTVVSIDTIYFCSQALRKFHFPPSLFNKTIYEGIGSSGGLIWSGSLCQAIEVGGCLIAYKKGLDSLYINCGLGSTGISEIAKKEFINIFPNPNSGTFTIQASKAGVFELMDVTGKIINTYTITDTHKTIHENLAVGMYFIREKQSEAVQKLVVQ